MKRPTKTAQIIQVQQILSSIQDRMVKAINDGANIEYNMHFEIIEVPNFEGSWNNHEPTGGFSVMIELIK